MLAADVDLDHPRVLGIERPIGKIGAEHQQRVAVLHGPVPGREAQQAGHADVVGVVVLDELLAAQRVNDGRLERASELDELVVGAAAAGAGQDRDPLGGIERLRRGGQLVVGGANHRRGRRDHGQPCVMTRAVQEDLAGHHHDRDAAAFDRMTHRDLQDPRQLLGHADQLGVDAALAEKLLGMGLLEIAAADLLARDVRRDRQHGDPAAVRVEQAVDEMQVPGTTTGGAYGQLPGHRRLAGGRERRCLLVAHVLPYHLTVATQRVGEPVDRIARQPVDPAHAGRLQGRHHDIGNSRLLGGPFRQASELAPRLV